MEKVLNVLKILWFTVINSLISVINTVRTIIWYIPVKYPHQDPHTNMDHGEISHHPVRVMRLVGDVLILRGVVIVLLPDSETHQTAHISNLGGLQGGIVLVQGPIQVVVYYRIAKTMGS